MTVWRAAAAQSLTRAELAIRRDGLHLKSAAEQAEVMEAPEDPESDLTGKDGLVRHIFLDVS